MNAERSREKQDGRFWARAESRSLATHVHTCRQGLLAVAVFSGATNILQFVVPIYMLQIYDRVITSRNEATLIALTATAALLIALFGALEALRTRILVRVGLTFSDEAAGSVFSAMLKGHGRHNGALRDLDTVRTFLSGAGLLALCDAPWFPLFVGAAFLLHPLYGWVALTGSALILGLAVGNELLTRHPLAEASRASVAAARSARSSIRNADVLRAMGMSDAVRRLWLRHHSQQLGQQSRASDHAAILIAGTRGSRLLLQVAILGTGALLAIRGDVTPGSIVVASILVGRALQPVETLVAQWRSVVEARAALRRLRSALDEDNGSPSNMTRPSPEGWLRCDSLSIALREGGPPALDGISFAAAPGETVAVLGPSGSGKSTLLRALAGVLPMQAGAVRLDGYDMGAWNEDERGAHIGYLPQTVDLFAGTVAENIARMQAPNPDDVIAAAQAAGCHDLIQLLPQGYDTLVGEDGAALSGGERQQIGLARAFYRAPRLVLLDEPSAHLDSQGHQRLLLALEYLKQRGATTILVSHSTMLLSEVDNILLLKAGVVINFGPRRDVLAGQQHISPAKRAS